MVLEPTTRKERLNRYGAQEQKNKDTRYTFHKYKTLKELEYIFGLLGHLKKCYISETMALCSYFCFSTQGFEQREFPSNPSHSQIVYCTELQDSYPALQCSISTSARFREVGGRPERGLPRTDISPFSNRENNEYPYNI
jgi:hypothetical protein